MTEQEQSFLTFFRDSYPEFANVGDGFILSTYNEVNCLYSEVFGITKECAKEIVTGYMVAHFIVTNSSSGSDSASGGGGFVTSASVGGISVSTQAPNVTDNLDYFFGGSIYGQKLLAYFASVGGLYYVN